MARSRQYPPSVDPGAPIEPPTPLGWSRYSFSDLFDVLERPAALLDKVEYQLVNARRSRGGIVARDRLKGHEIRVKTQFALEAGDFLMSKRQIIHGACGIVPDKLAGAVVSNEYTVLRPKPPLTAEYLRFLPETPYFQRTCFHSSVGVDVEKMVFKLDQWFRYQLPLPGSDEQRKIAAVLSSVDEASEKTEAVIDQLEVVKKGLLGELLTRGMPGRHREFQDTPIGRIPASWGLQTASSLCERMVVGIVVQPARYYVESGVPCLRSQNVREDRLSLGNLVFISPESNRLHAKSIIRTGDVLTVRTGYPGTSAVASRDIEGANCVDLILSTPRSAILRGSFLSRFINSEVGMEQVAVHQGGLAQQHFNVGAMKLLLVPVPSLKEQDEILERLAAIDSSLVGNNSILDSIRTMKQGLLDALLSGRVRVTAPAQETV